MQINVPAQEKNPQILITTLNSNVFKNWFLQFLNKLYELNIQTAVIVMDNASYHSVIVDKAPTSSTKQPDILQRLSRKNIPYGPN
jgi:transposase